jgi:hypothetical protein
VWVSAKGIPGLHLQKIKDTRVVSFIFSFGGVGFGFEPLAPSRRNGSNLQPRKNG